MVIIETDIFTKRITQLMSDDEYAAFQADLIANPKQGALIRGSGGLRKMRWATEKGKGKSGGSRVIYYWVASDNQIRMLYAYRKAEQENMTPDQLKLLRQIVERW